MKTAMRRIQQIYPTDQRYADCGICSEHKLMKFSDTATGIQFCLDCLEDVMEADSFLQHSQRKTGVRHPLHPQEVPNT